MRDSSTVVQQGFQAFRDAPQAWPYTIAFTGKSQGWDKAKHLAAECAQRFPLDAQACGQAALSPAELRQQQKESETKAQNLIKKIFGR